VITGLICFIRVIKVVRGFGVILLLSELLGIFAFFLVVRVI
jgi:hypothetical protein